MNILCVVKIDGGYVGEEYESFGWLGFFVGVILVGFGFVLLLWEGGVLGFYMMGLLW